MSAGSNVAQPRSPIDLETVRRNLREVMTNLQLLETGENVRVEDLINQARANLNENRIFILRNIGNFGINPRVNNVEIENNGNEIREENNRNGNGLFNVNLERLEPVADQDQIIRAVEPQPPRQNNAEQPVYVNQEFNVQPNLPSNTVKITFKPMEGQFRDWADVERNRTTFCRFRNVPFNDIPNGNDDILRTSDIDQLIATITRADRRVNACTYLVRYEAINRAIDGWLADNHIPRPDDPPPETVSLEICPRPRKLAVNGLLASIQRVRRCMWGPGMSRRDELIRVIKEWRLNNRRIVPRFAPPRQNDIVNRGVLEGIAPIEFRPLGRLANAANGPLEGRPLAANRTVERPAPVVVMGGPIPFQREPYQRPAVIPRNVRGLEGRIQQLQERLDRLEDGRFYDVMIAGRGEDRIRRMIRSLRSRLEQCNAAGRAPPRVNLARDLRNPPDAEAADLRFCNPPIIFARDPAVLIPQNPVRPNVQFPTGPNVQNPLVRNTENLVTRNQCEQNDTVMKVIQGSKRQLLDGESSERVDYHQNYPVKRSNMGDSGCSGRSTNPVPWTSNNENITVNLPDRRSTFDTVLIGTNVIENYKKKSRNSPDDQLPGPSGYRRESQRDDQLPGPSGVRYDHQMSQNKVQNRTDINWPRKIKMDSDSEESNSDREEDENISENEENEEVAQDSERNQQNNEQDQNAEVIFVSANIRLPIVKIERESDDEDEGNDGQNQENKVFLEIEDHRMLLPAAPALTIPRENRAEPVRPVSIPEVNYCRQILRHHARVRGPEFPGTIDRPFLTLETMKAGLQNLIMQEARHFGNQDREIANLGDNQWDAVMLELMKTYVKLRKELREVILNTERLGIRSRTVSNTHTSIVVTFNLGGLQGTPYDGGQIGVEIRGRPFKQLGFASEVSLKTRIWHPNVCPFTGGFLDENLRHYRWSDMTIFQVLFTIRKLLKTPELEFSITHEVIARQFTNNNEIFRRTAQHWMSVYGPYENLAIPEYAELLDRLVEEGIPRERALHLLSKNDWDIDKAMDEIS